MKGISVAIDGPAGAGKSTIARLVAEKLGAVYIDTGAMYRAVAWNVLQEEKSPDEARIIDVAEQSDIALQAEADGLHVFLNGRDITAEIRLPEVTQLVSKVAQLADVRKKMVVLQRKMAAEGRVVMDGRDIASHVLPNADVKIFLTASVEERARRRWQEMSEKAAKGGAVMSIEEVRADIVARDKADTERKVSPLRQVPEAFLLDSTGMKIEDVVEEILKRCR